MLTKEWLFWWGGIGFVGGVGYGSFFAFDVFVFALVFSAFALALTLSFSRPVGLFVLIVSVCFLAGAWRSLDVRERFAEEHLQAKSVFGEVRVVNDPEVKSFYQEVILRAEHCETELCPEEKILWQASRAKDIRAGDRYRFSCTLELPKNFSDDFDYRMFLAKDGIGYVCKKGEAQSLPGDARTRIVQGLFAPKHLLERMLAENLSQPEAGLSAGLLVGGDDRLPRSLQEAFTRIGLTHVVAVSGYNIALIASGLLWFLIALGLWRRYATLCAAIGIVLFVLMIGAPASAVRAGTMAFLTFLIFQFGRLTGASRALLLVLVMMLLFNPLLLRYDVGFQLSFLATLAIIFAASWQPLVFPKDFPGKGFVEIAYLTAVVELFVLPVILFSFHMFSPYVLLANALFLPLVPVAMGLSFAGALLSWMLPDVLHVFLMAPAWGVLTAMTRMAERIAGWPGASVTTESFGLWAVVSWYVLLLFVVWRLETFRKRKLYEEETLV